LWGLDYGITDVAHRADDGGYKPLAARHQVSLREAVGGGKVVFEYTEDSQVSGILRSESFILQDTTRPRPLSKSNL